MRTVCQSWREGGGTVGSQVMNGVTPLSCCHAAHRLTQSPALFLLEPKFPTPDSNTDCLDSGGYLPNSSLHLGAQAAYTDINLSKTIK